LAVAYALRVSGVGGLIGDFINSTRPILVEAWPAGPWPDSWDSGFIACGGRSVRFLWVYDLNQPANFFLGRLQIIDSVKGIVGRSNQPASAAGVYNVINASWDTSFTPEPDLFFVIPFSNTCELIHLDWPEWNSL